MPLSPDGSFLAGSKPIALLAALAAAALASLGSPGTAQSYELNAHFEREAITGDVQDFRVKFNGNFVFFRADERRTGVFELFTVPVLGGAAPFRENRILPEDRSVVLYEPSPAGNWIVFVADQDRDDVFELYSRKPSDTKPRKLSGTMPSFGDVDAIAVTSDGTRVVYSADAEADAVREIYSVAIDGSWPPVKISATQPGGQGLFGDFMVSSTGARVVYLDDPDGSLVFDLYSAPTDGSSAPEQLNAELVWGGSFLGSIAPVAITPDGTTVVYRVDQDVDEVRELFRVPIDGSGAPTQINPTLPVGGDVMAFVLSPDSQRVVYVADQTANDVFAVWSAPLSGGAPVALNSPGQAAEIAAVSPDSSRVVLDVILASKRALQSVAIDGSSAPVTLDTLPIGESDEFMDVSMSPDSLRVVYRTGDQDCLYGCFNVYSLRSVPVDGAASPVALDPGDGGFLVDNDEPAGVPFTISSDSTRVVYQWGQTGPGTELYSAPSDGSTAPVVLARGNVTREYALSPTGPRAFFLADLAGGQVFELYSVHSVDGSGLVELSGSLARDTFADVFTPASFLAQAFRIDDASERVVYSADPEVDEEFELFVTDVDGQTGVVPIEDEREVRHFELSPDGQRLVYCFEPDAGHPAAGKVHSVPVDGSASPVELPLPALLAVGDFQVNATSTHVVYRPINLSGLFGAPIAGGPLITYHSGTVLDFVLDPSGARVAYTTFQSGTGYTLRSAPVDGSQAPVVLHGPTGFSSSFRFRPDGTQVAYRSGADGRVYAVPADGSASPVLLSGTTTPQCAPAYSPDGAWVVYAGDAGVGTGFIDLFSVPSDGSTAPEKLSGPLVPSGDVFFTPDACALVSTSNRVVYVADQEVNEVYELYSVPIDGGTSAVELSQAQVPGGDVFVHSLVGLRHVQIAADGSRVVYVADAETNEVHELYSVPIDGSGSPVKLSGLLVSDGDVAAGPFGGASGAYRLERAFQISPDSTRVVYVADQETDDLLEIFLAPLDGSLPPRKLNWPLARDGVAAFEITPDSRRVLYQATERGLVTELFASGLSFQAVHPRAAPGKRP